MLSFDNWPTWAITAYLIVDITVRIIAVIQVPRNRRPTAAMAWLLAIFFIPVVGVLLLVFCLLQRLLTHRTAQRH